MRIGEAARETGLESSAIRFYEQKGIVPAPARSPAGYREYAGGDVDLLRFVRRLRSLGLPLDDVREVVSLRTRGTAPCAAVREAITREAASIDQKIADLLGVRDELLRLEAEAERIEDDWPASCVCHLIDTNAGEP